MTKTQVFELLYKAIKHIEQNFNAEDREYYIDNPLSEANLPFEFSVESGISKAVIIIKDLPFVIKMPFFKIYDEDGYNCLHADWSWNKQEAIDDFVSQFKKEKGLNSYPPPQMMEKFCEEWIAENPEPSDEEIYYCDIEGASNIDLDDMPAIPDWDYCRLEQVIYQLALEEGLGAYFAEEGYLGTIDQTPVYYQTRCTPLSEMNINYDSEEYKKKSDKSEAICQELGIGCFNEIWIYDFVNLYGKGRVKTCRYC
jgi:hypothetical protein